LRIVAPKPDQQKPYYLNEIQENSTMSIDSLHEAFYDEALSLLKQNMSDEESATKRLTQLSKQVNATANV